MERSLGRWVAGIAAVVSLAACGKRDGGPADPGAPGAAAEATAGAGSRLTIIGRDAAGGTVGISSAEILLSAWGEAKRLPLEVRDGKTALTLDLAWLVERWPLAGDSAHKGYLYMKAEGFAPVRSEPFLWIGSRDPASAWEPAAASDVRLGDGTAVRIEEGRSGTLPVTFRRPRPRHLRLVERDGSPVAGARIYAALFWSNENHCGVLSGFEALGSWTSDDRGAIAVPDLDGEYALTLDGPMEGRPEVRVFESPGTVSWDPRVLIARLGEEETEIVVHERKRRPIEMAVTRGGSPAAGWILFMKLREPACIDDGIHELARTGVDGRLGVSAFIPEDCEEVWLAPPGGGRAWTGAPEDLPDGPFEVKLP